MSTDSIVNLTPHPVTIIRSTSDGARTTTAYPACSPADLPRAVEEPRGYPHGGALPAIPHDDSQLAYAMCEYHQATGVVDGIGYVGVVGLPEFQPREIFAGTKKLYIVSIVTAIGAVAAGRPIHDLLVPCGQVRDESGRVVGATGLAPAEILLASMAERIYARRG